MKSVFIITTCIKSHDKLNMLNNCVKGIRSFHPDTDIVILKDNCDNAVWSEDELKGCKIENVLYELSGEINAYVWSIQHKDEYERFIYIHDSTYVFNTIPLEMPEGCIFRPIWHAEGYINGFRSSERTNRIIKEYNQNIHKQFQMVIHNEGELSFGAMGIWTTDFAQKLSETNFLDIAGYLKTREDRCFTERFIYCVAYNWQPCDTWRKISLCGDIFKHGHPFANGSADPSVSHNNYIVKLWCGR
jgi:hypothetical protein